MSKITLASTLRDRWPVAADARPDLGSVKAAAWRALDTHEALGKTLAEKRAEFGRPGTLSAKGVAEKVRGFLAGGIIPELRNHRAEISRRTEDLKARRAALAKPTVDKSDLVAELQRAELRAYVRSLDAGARVSTLLSDSDGAMIEACLTAAPILSGFDRLSDLQRDQIVSRYVEARHGPTLAALAVEESALEIAETAMRAALMELRDEVELPAHQFEAWFDTGVEPLAEAA